MKTYKLYQVGFDGDYVLDSEHENLEDAQETSANLGSKWYFNPLSVIVSGVSIVETGGSQCYRNTGEPVLSAIFKHKRFKTLCKIFEKYSKKPELEGADWEQFEDEIIKDLES